MAFFTSMYAILVYVLLGTALFMDRPSQRGKIDAQELNRRFATMACIMLFVIYGLRNAYVIGADSSSSYVHRFQDIETLPMANFFGGNNWGFFLLMKIVSRLTGGNYQVFITLISAFIMYVVTRFLRKYSPDTLQSVLYFMGLLLYPLFFSALKQSIAMAFILLAFDGIVEKKPIRFLVFVVLAAFFHIPALVFLPAYWIVKLGVGRNYLLMLAGILVIVYLFRAQILVLMLSMYDTTVSEEGTGFLRGKSIIMLVIIAAALILRPPTKEDTLYTQLLSFMGLAVVFQTFCAYNNTFERLADYYFQFAIIFIPMVFDRTKETRSPLTEVTEQRIKQWAPYGFGLFGIYRFLHYVQGNAWMFLPYRFFFQHYR